VPLYKIAADHFTLSSSSANKVPPPNRFEVNNSEAMPAAFEGQTSAHTHKPTNDDHYLIQDELVQCRNQLFENVVPLAGQTLEASTREPLGDLDH
jgi:hypothetical protein